ncbi:MAG: NAD(P)/FAD-dependent oxidoreductase, partial [Spirochaetales bacterium]|nr:NAD(P)/FAD-dependent oxidoreductase [Spirochaetales bacterium]
NYRDLLKKHGNFIRTGAKTADEVADALDIPQGARDLLYPYWCYLGVPTNRLSFSIWAALLNSYISSGAVIPAMRSHELASAFVSKIEEFGGEIRFNTKVNKIIVNNGSISGVETANGELLLAERVVSNASQTLVFNSLISPASTVPDLALKNVNSRKLGFSLVVVYLGLNADMEELGISDYSYFIAPHMNTDKLYKAIYNLDTDEIMQATVCLNAANPDCSPPGTTILAITAGYRAEAWANVAEKDYFKTKNIIAEKLIGQFENATGVPLREHIEEIEVATPETFARYTGAHDGIVYGYEPEPWDSIIPRALSVENEDYIKGLTFCGGFSVRCHGYGSSILSGKAAAERMIKQMEGNL